MTFRDDFTLPAELLKQVQEQGLDILSELLRVILNGAMQAEAADDLRTIFNAPDRTTAETDLTKTVIKYVFAITALLYHVSLPFDHYPPFNWLAPNSTHITLLFKLFKTLLQRWQ